MILKLIERNHWLIITIALCLAVIGCKDFEDCRTDYTSLIEVQFLPLDKNSNKILGFDSVVASTNVMWGAAKQVKTLLLPLNPGADSTTFRFYKSNPNTVDTLTIFYKRATSLIAPQCGAQQEYTLDSLQTTFAKDSIIHASLRKSTKEPDVQISY